MGRIKAGELKFMVATDVAARGIDISQLTHVISYSSPVTPEVYVHRTGRTGRAGKAGIAISLVSGLDIGNFKHLQNVNKIEVLERKLPTEADILARMRERLEVKTEQEVRAIPERERSWRVDRWIPLVEALAASEDGRRDLAAICASYLREHRPLTTIDEPRPGAAGPGARVVTDPDAERAPQKRPGGGRGGGGRRRRR